MPGKRNRTIYSFLPKARAQRQRSASSINNLQLMIRSCRMRLSPLTWTGLSLVGVAVIVFGGWALWSETRTYIPVDMPISMTVGHVQTPEFSVNVNNMPYDITIVAEK